MSLLEFYDANDPGPGRNAQSRTRESNAFLRLVVDLILNLLMRKLDVSSLRDLCGKLDEQFGDLEVAAAEEPKKKKKTTKKKATA